MIIDDVREYWDRQPCNIKHSNAPFGTKQWSDEISERKYFVEPHIPGFAQFERWKDKRVLEVGCGIGTDAISFCKARAVYFGLDLSEESVKIANKRLGLYNFERTCLQWNMEDSVSFGKGNFDLVYSFGVIHHTPNPGKIIENISKVIKPEGELRIMLYASNSWKRYMVRAGLDQWEAQGACPLVRLYDEEEVRGLLHPYFYLTDFQQTHIFPYVVEDYKNYIYTKQPYFREMSKEMFEALERNLGQHLLVTAKPIL